MRRGTPSCALAILILTVVCACRARKPSPDTLVLLVQRDVEGLDPHTSGALWETQTVLANLYEGLVGFDARLEPIPMLASSWSNPDGTTWEFTLRPGVLFQTGEPLEPEDVVFSLTRGRDHPSSALKSSLSNIEAIEVSTDRKVRIRTATPDALLLAHLRDAYVVSRRFVLSKGEAALATTSAGTGPYRLSNRDVGTSVDLERFPSYWRGAATVPKARFVARPYGSPDLARFLTPGSRVVFSSNAGTPIFQEAKRTFDQQTVPNLSVSYLAFDLRGPTTPGVTLPDGSHRNPFLDLGVRRAIARAIDLSRLKKAAVDDYGFITSQLVPPLVFGFDATLPILKPDPGVARELLSSTPYAGGFDVDLDVRDMMSTYAATLVEDLNAIGIRARAQKHQEKEFFDKVKEGRSSLYVLRFSCRTGDVQEFFDKWVHSHDPKRGHGEYNFSYQVNPVAGLDEAIDRARAEFDTLARRQSLQDIMRKVMDAQLAIPLLNTKDVIFTSKDVEWNPRADTLRLAYDARFD